MGAKLKALAVLSVKNYRELFDRLSSIAQIRLAPKSDRPFYEVQAESRSLHLLQLELRRDLTEVRREISLAEIEQEVECGKRQIPSDAPFGAFHNADLSLGRLCYVIARSLQPRVIVETGVCYGVTSAFLLKALQLNGMGCLHSIDLPPLGENAGDNVGRLVPAALRGRWILHRGTTKRLLRPLLAGLAEIDMFIHDSLHTYQNMRMEFGFAWQALRTGGVLISDDVESNTAFKELTSLADVSLALVMKEQSKASLFGIVVKRT